MENTLKDYMKIVVETDEKEPQTIAEIKADIVTPADGYRVRMIPSYVAQPEPMYWNRFELMTESEAERERLERVLQKSNLSRRELAIILFGLRVRPGFGKEDFGI